MRHFVAFAFFFCYASLGSAAGFLLQGEQPAASLAPCKVASDARGIEGLLRTIRLVVKLTNQTELRHFLLQKADEIRSAISSTHRMLAIIGDGMEEGSTFTDTFFTEGYVKTLSIEPLKALDVIQMLNATETTQVFEKFQQHANRFYEDILEARSGPLGRPDEVMEDVEEVLDFAIKRCRFIYENGCSNQTENSPIPEL